MVFFLFLLVPITNRLMRRIILPGELRQGEEDRLKSDFWRSTGKQAHLGTSPDLSPDQVSSIQKSFGARLDEWDSSPQGTVVLDPEFRIVFWNMDARHSGGDAWGRPRDMVLGKKYQTVVPGIVEEGRMQPLEDVLRGRCENVEILEMPHESRRRDMVVYQDLKITRFQSKVGAESAPFIRLQITDETSKVALRNLIHDIAASTEYDEILHKGLNGLCEVLSCPKAALRRMQEGEGGLRIISPPVASSLRQEAEGGWKPSELEHLRYHSSPDGLPSRFTLKLIETGSVVAVDLSSGVRQWDDARNMLVDSNEDPADLISISSAESRGLERVAGVILKGAGGEVIGGVRAYNWRGEFGDRQALLLREFGTAFSIALENSMDRQMVVDARKEAEGKRRMIEVLASMGAHDIKNPLTAIGMWTFSGVNRVGKLVSKLESGGQVNDEDLESLRAVANGLAIVKEETQACKSRADGLRELLVSSGSARYERVGLDSVIGDAVSVFGVLAQEKNVPVRVDVADDVPDALACRDDVSRILGNLVKNAVEHTQAGGRVIISAGKNEDLVDIEVSNTGEHIPDDKLASIFEGAGESTSGGWGVGLSSVRFLVKKQGGKISANNTLDEEGRSQVSFRISLRSYESPEEPTT